MLDIFVFDKWVVVFPGSIMFQFPLKSQLIWQPTKLLNTQEVAYARLRTIWTNTVSTRESIVYKRYRANQSYLYQQCCMCDFERCNSCGRKKGCMKNLYAHTIIVLLCKQQGIFSKKKQQGIWGYNIVFANGRRIILKCGIAHPQISH